MARTRIHGQQVTDGSIELVDLSSALASTISGKADAGNLAPVATSGSYNDLTNLPTLFSGAYADLTGKPTLFSGSYTDLTNKPTLFSGSYTDLTNKPTLASFTTLTSPSSGQFLKYNGSAWINASLPVADASTSGVVSTSAQTFAGGKTFTTAPWIKASGPYIAFEETAAGYRGFGISTYQGLMLFSRTAVNSTTFENKNGQWGFAHNLETHKTGINNITPVAQLHVNAADASYKGFIVQGAASQTANLFEVQNSSGTGLFVIDSAGAINLPTTSPLMIKGNSGHTWNNTLMRVTDSTSAAYYFTVYGNGRMRMGTNDAPTSQGGDLLGTSNYTLAVNALSAGDGALCIQHPTNNVNPLILASTPSGVVLNVSQYGMYIKNLTAGYTPLRVDSVAGAANLMDVKSAGTSKFVVDSTGSITTGIVPVARVTGLHAVATSGSYNDLSDKPSIPSIAGLATESYVDTKVADLVASAPAVLDTLNELAAALGDDPNFATTMTTALAAKADSSSLAAVATSGSYADLSNKPSIYTPVKEVFTALVDGTETVFVLADAPAVAGTEQVFVNGILQSAGASDDYTISGDTITFNTAPEAGWKLIVYYFV